MTGAIPADATRTGTSSRIHASATIGADGSVSLLVSALSFDTIVARLILVASNPAATSDRHSAISRVTRQSQPSRMSVDSRFVVSRYAIVLCDQRSRSAHAERVTARRLCSTSPTRMQTYRTIYERTPAVNFAASVLNASLFAGIGRLM